MRILILLAMVSNTFFCMGQDCNGENFFNTDGSQNAYFIDTLHIDSLVIVRSKKNGHFFAFKHPVKLKGKIWNSPEVYLYEDDEYFDGWYFKDLPENAIPNDIIGTSLNGGEMFKYIHTPNSMAYQVVSNKRTPQYYWLVLIRGDAYNFLTVRSVFDNGRKVIKFRDEKAYYKLLIPVW